MFLVAMFLVVRVAMFLVVRVAMFLAARVARVVPTIQTPILFKQHPYTLGHCKGKKTHGILVILRIWVILVILVFLRSLRKITQGTPSQLPDPLTERGTTLGETWYSL